MHLQVWKGGNDSDTESHVSEGGALIESGDEDEAGGEDEEGEDKKDFLNELRAQIKFSDAPRPRESLADFFSRTKDIWTDLVKSKHEGREQEELSRKDLKKAGFELAEVRFQELSGACEELARLDPSCPVMPPAPPSEKKDKKEKKEKKGKKEKKKKERNVDS